MVSRASFSLSSRPLIYSMKILLWQVSIASVALTTLANPIAPRAVLVAVFGVINIIRNIIVVVVSFELLRLVPKLGVQAYLLH